MYKKVLRSFLVGVGLDTSDFEKGDKKVTSGLSRFRSVAGLAGAAMVGAMGAAGAAAMNAGSRIDKLNLSAERVSASSGFVYNFGNALRTLGGDSSEALSAISSIDSALDSLRLKGEFGAFSEAAFSGADIDALSRASSAEEFLRISAEIVPTLDKQQQRLFQESFGFSDATMRSLKEGSQRFDELINRAGRLAAGFDGATAAARDYNKELTEFQLRLEGISNTLAERMLPTFTGMLESVNKFIDGNSKSINAAIDLTEKSPVGSFVAVSGAGAAGAGSAMSGLGMKTTGRAVSRLGIPGMAIGSGMMLWDATPDDIENLTGYRPNSFIFDYTLGDAVSDIRKWISGESNSSVVDSQDSVQNIQPSAHESYSFIDSSVSYVYGNEYVDKNEYSSDSLENYNYETREWVVNEHSSESHDSLENYIEKSNIYNNLTDSDISYQYINDGAIGNIEAAESAPEFIIIQNQSTERDRKPAQQRIQNNLNIRMELDGRALENKIIDVSERREQAAIDDLQSTTVR